MEKYDTLVCSGNSTNVVTTLGALQYCHEQDCLTHITCYIGTSSGAIVSLLLLVGYTPLDIITYLCVEQVYKKVGQYNLSNLILANKALMNFKDIHQTIGDMIIEKLGKIPTLKELEDHTGKRLITTTYNLTDDQLEYISSQTYPDVLVTDAITMSSTFPLVFEPFQYENKLYWDGGLADNFPIELGQKMGKQCLGIITINPIPNYDSNMNLLTKMIMAAQVPIKNVALEKIRRTQCDILMLKIPLNFFNFTSSNKDLLIMFDKGYALCKQQILEVGFKCLDERQKYTHLYTTTRNDNIHDPSK
mgnify:CR=1 FL=1